ncbi:MAG: hypothetical protein BWY62_00602 [Firmicutes bacterium ADurb.Bin356]|nr:MAG: hypothetical protein BWY62_00602 [Firmicutes bacterium ADurb.Bin356]
MEKSLKVYVPVLAAFSTDGTLMPRKLRYEDGTLYTIERVSDIRPSPALKAGGQGDRYTIQVQGKESYLFFEHNTDTSSAKLGRWFVERK